MSKPHVVVIEALPAEICEECGKLEELRPYGKRKENGVRMWLCFDCATLDKAEVNRAFEERFTGENEV